MTILAVLWSLQSSRSLSCSDDAARGWSGVPRPDVSADFTPGASREVIHRFLLEITFTDNVIAANPKLGRFHCHTSYSS